MAVRVKGRTAVVAEQAVEVVRWTVLAAVIGATVGLVVFAFVEGVHRLWEAVQGLGVWAPFVAPVAAALMVGATVYRTCPAARGAGTPDYIYAVNTRQGYIRNRLLLTKLAASVLTLGSGLSGGLIGPAGLVGGGIGANLGRRLRWLFPRTVHGRQDMRLATVCGASAAVAAVLHAPLGAAVFAVEILFPASIHYEYYFPAALASVAGYVVSGLLSGWQTLVAAPPLALGWGLVVPVLATTMLVTLASLGFVWLYQAVHRVAYRRRRPAWGGPVAGAVIFVALALAAGPNLSSSGEWHLRWLVGAAVPVGVAALFLVGKAAATAVVVGSGNSGGFTGPTILLGAAGGALVAGALGVTDPAIEAAACAAGIAGALAAVLNVPIAATLIVAELFGLPYLVPALVGSVLAYKMAKPVFVYEYVSPVPVVRWRVTGSPAERNRRHGLPG